MTSSPSPSSAGSIVVGVDGSPGSDRALAWAARQAALEGRHLTLAHSARLSAGGDALGFVLSGADLAEEMELTGHVLLDDADRRVHEIAPGLTVHRCLRTDVDARRMLLELAEDASTLAVGSRGRGPLTSALLGSVSVAVSKRAPCPVVVVRRSRNAAAGYGVVVEVSEGDAGRAAVEYAYRTAELHDWPVTVVRTVWVPGHLGAGGGDVGPDVPGLDAERTDVAEVVARMAAEHPDLVARTRIVNGVREHVLVRTSTDADLLVLGTHHLESLEDLLQAAGVATVVEHAACDVAVVPARTPAPALAPASVGDGLVQGHGPAQA